MRVLGVNSTMSWISLDFRGLLLMSSCFSTSESTSLFIYIPAMLRNEVGWFDEEENSAETLSMRLANDATFVRAAFSNRLSIFVQDVAAVIVAVLIGMLLQWRLALVALATLPVLMVSALAQVSFYPLYTFYPQPLFVCFS